MKEEIAEKLMLLVFILLALVLFSFISFEYGRKDLCHEMNGLYSMDYGHCFMGKK